MCLSSFILSSGSIVFFFPLFTFCKYYSICPSAMASSLSFILKIVILLSPTELLIKHINNRKTSSTLKSIFSLNLDSLRIVQWFSFRSSNSILRYGDIEPNPGWHDGLRLLHWNLNSMKKDDFSRVGLEDTSLPARHSLIIVMMTKMHVIHVKN